MIGKTVERNDFKKLIIKLKTKENRKCPITENKEFGAMLWTNGIQAKRESFLNEGMELMIYPTQITLLVNLDLKKLMERNAQRVTEDKEDAKVEAHSASEARKKVRERGFRRS